MREEEALVEAQPMVRTRYPGALLVMAPSHPNRFGEVAKLAVGEPRSQIRAPLASTGGRRAVAEAEILLLDTLGELLDFYAAGDVAFVGGSLVPIGGHNLLEPAALGLPILTGPNNF